MNLRMVGLVALIASAVTIGCGESATDAGNNAVTLKVTNELLRPVTINANGKEVMTVEASSTKEVDLGRLDTLKIDWDLVNSTIGGTTVGDHVGGIFSTKHDPSGTISMTIDNVISGYKVFIPFLANNTALPLETVVNFGLEDENKCECSIAPSNQQTELGYYWLYGSTMIRAYKSGSNYSGQYAYWSYGEQFNSSDIEYETGRLLLTANKLGLANPVEHPIDRISAAPFAENGTSASGTVLTGEVAK